VDDISEGARLCFRVGGGKHKVDEGARICPRSAEWVVSASCWHVLEFLILRQKFNFESKSVPVLVPPIKRSRIPGHLVIEGDGGYSNCGVFYLT